METKNTKSAESAEKISKMSDELTELTKELHRLNKEKNTAASEERKARVKLFEAMKREKVKTVTLHEEGIEARISKTKKTVADMEKLWTLIEDGTLQSEEVYEIVTVTKKALADKFGNDVADTVTRVKLGTENVGLVAIA